MKYGLITLIAGLVLISIVVLFIEIERASGTATPVLPPTHTTVLGRGKVTEDGRFYLYVFHDDDRHVTCWQYGNAMSCLPDSQVHRPLPVLKE